MAGDWIKMRNDLADDPAVIAIAGQVGLDEFAVVGRLHALWAWADEQSRDGHARGVTSAWLDRKVQRDGFAAALVDVGWLEVAEDGLRLPNFDHHNGKTAKVRALGTRRKQAQRTPGAPALVPPTVPSSVTPLFPEVSRSQRDKSATREEKRREEQKTPPTPKGEGRFPEFWTLWPKSPRKGGRPEALKVWQARDLDREAALILAHVQSLSATEGWTKQGGEFVPAPVVYLRGRRWDGADTAETRAAATAIDWRSTRDGVQGRAYQLGFGPYEQIDGQGRGVSFAAYRAKVIAADAAAKEPA